MRLLCCLTYLIGLLLPFGLCADTTLRAPLVSAVGGFFAGAAPKRMRALERLQISGIRDSLLWRDVVLPDNAVRWGYASGASMAQLSVQGLLGTLMLMPQTPWRNGQRTITSADDIAAFAQFVGIVAARFPNVQIEIANEFNGGAFVSGPARQLKAVARAALYVRLLQAIAARGVDQNRLVGGALHSLAGGYLWALLDAGAGAHMGAVAIHPYTTEPEAYVRQLEVLRRHPDMQGRPVDFTEFGTRQEPRAADFFWRAYCKMAQAGVRQAHWYPLDARKDGYAPILTTNRTLTPVGRAVAYAHQHLSGGDVDVFAPDPHTHGCVFKKRLLVLWGAPRSVQVLRKDITLSTASLDPVAPPRTIDRDRVLLFAVPKGGPPIDLQKDIAIAAHRVLFDSFDQFLYPPAPIHHFVTKEGQEYDFETCPGQDRPEAPWFPHLCVSDLPGAVLHDRGFVLPAGGGDLHILHPFSASANVDIAVALKILSGSTDGVEITLRLGDRIIGQEQVIGDRVFHFGPMTVSKGSILRLTLGPGGSAIGDRGKLRLRATAAEGQ